VVFPLCGLFCVNSDDISCEMQVRIQLGQGTAAEVTRNMLREHGVGAFYNVCLEFLCGNFALKPIRYNAFAFK
jgi:hypothetical protein